LRVTKGSARWFVAPVTCELIPSQGDFNEPLPVVPLGRCGALHRGLGFLLWIVLAAHEADFSQPIWTSAWQFPPYDCGGEMLLLMLYARHGCCQQRSALAV
jgi:hypothetical protein